jgi:hypothetical protein
LPQVAQDFVTTPLREIHVKQHQHWATGVFIGVHCIEKLYRRMPVRDDVHIRVHFGSLQGLADQEYVRTAVLDDKNIRNCGVYITSLGQ